MEKNESFGEKVKKISIRHEGSNAAEGQIGSEEAKSAYKDNPEEFIRGAKSSHWSAKDIDPEKLD